MHGSDLDCAWLYGPTKHVELELRGPLKSKGAQGGQGLCVPFLSFPKIQSGGIRAVRQNQRIIKCDVCQYCSKGRTPPSTASWEGPGVIGLNRQGMNVSSRWLIRHVGLQPGPFFSTIRLLTP